MRPSPEADWAPGSLRCEAPGAQRFGVWGSGLRVWGFGFRVWGLGLGV